MRLLQSNPPRLELDSLIPSFGLHDLKSEFRGRFYAQEALKPLPDSPDPLLIDDLFARLAFIEAIHS